MSRVITIRKSRNSLKYYNILTLHNNEITYKIEPHIIATTIKENSKKKSKQK